MAKFRIRNNARNQAESQCFRRTDLPARKDEISGSAHADEVRQSHHGNGRKTTQLDLRLAELRGFCGNYKIAKSGKLHAATEAESVDGGDFHAIGLRKPAENGVKRGEHFADAFGSVIRDLRAGAKSFGARALKNHEVRFRESTMQRCIQRFHHSNIENVGRGPVQGDPGRAGCDANRNRFAGVSHNRGKSRIKNLFALKFGSTPFEKGLNPFPAIFGEIATELFVDLVLESTDEILLASGKELFLHRANGQIRT